MKCSDLFISFLKDSTSKWAKICFYTSVLRRLKAETVKHKVSNRIDQHALKCSAFETATRLFRGQQLHTLTRKRTELHYSCVTFIRIQHARASWLALSSGNPKGPPTVPTHPLLLHALSSHFKTRTHNLRPSVWIFWGNLAPAGIWTCVVKITIKSCQPAVSACPHHQTQSPGKTGRKISLLVYRRSFSFLEPNEMEIAAQMNMMFLFVFRKYLMRTVA